MSYNTKNYMEQGGEKWVIGGELEILPGASVKGKRQIFPTYTDSKIHEKLSVSERQEVRANERK